MKLPVAFLTLTLLATAAFAAEQQVWKWVDAQGVTHYSDRPVPGAEPVNVRAPRVPASAPAAPPVTAPAASPATPAGRAPTAAAYRSVEIWRPTREETFANTGGSVPVRVRLDPQLLPQHSVTLYLNGQLVSGLPDGTLDFELTEIPRGTHSVVAAVLDAGGQVVQQSPAVVFHVRQTSIAQPPVGPALRPRS